METHTSNRLNRTEAWTLIVQSREDHWSTVGTLAHGQRLDRHGKTTTYVHNLHVNPSNICHAGCKVCRFGVSPGSSKGYVLGLPEILDRVAESEPDEVHIVGGLNDMWNLARSLELVGALRRCHPRMTIKGFTAVEIDWFARNTELPVAVVLERLQKAGLDGLPGGGAELFSENIRKQLFPNKISSERWLQIHETAHRLGLFSNATMLCGLGEGWMERIDHLLALRDLQDRTGGFTAFIPLTRQFSNPADSRSLSPLENLAIIAMSRLILDNISHIKSYWPMMGIETAAVGLSWGADDMDGVIGQERIAHAAGADTPAGLTPKALRAIIRGAGFDPVRRDGRFQLLKNY
ncbi:MAG: CofH family radical SAM protein [Magnetococcales bacterium]|nr:CofH family radical SAM protein [Magnetococcales bacterium]